MFAKLLKYEWKATSRLLGILTLCALGIGLLGGGVVQALVFFVQKSVVRGEAALATVGFSFLLMGLFFALVIYAAGIQFYLLFRFYKSRFTDEGYLTFTLPASNRSIFLSSYANTLLWEFIAMATVFASVGIAVLIGCIGNVDGEWQEVFYVFREFRDIYASVGLDGMMAIQIVGAVLSYASGVMVMMGSITVGAVVAKKHKILAAIGIYYGQSVVMSIISGVIQIFASFSMLGSYGSFDGYIWMYCLTYVLQLGWGIGAYFLSMHLINKKLNLP